MAEHLSTERIDSIPNDATLAHYDELSDSAKRTLADHHARDDPGTLDTALSSEFDRWDVIKFTDYLAVSVDCSC